MPSRLTPVVIAALSALASAPVHAFPWYAKADSEPNAASAPTGDPDATKPVAPPQRPDYSGITLPGQVSLHGRFDLNYERVGYSDNPFSGGRNAFQNYHRLLFLVRDAKDDPFTFNVEIINQAWYEIAYRTSFANGKYRLRVKAGRILVPFGADPLFHHTYGGRAGFDQQLLPVIWAQHGATANVQTRIGPVTVADDVYGVQGYMLQRADGVLNLQSDFSPIDDAHVAIGNRISASYGPFTAYYSAYFNGLGFGRRLFMQAFDFTLWRFYGVPVLERFTLDFGVIRADVSGGESRGYGGPNDDYYHFADYLQLRYYPFDWLYVQLRTGIKTMNNRRGVIADDTRYDVSDTTSHNLAVVARYRNLTGSIYHFWNFEKRDEIANDVLRFAVIYEF